MTGINKVFFQSPSGPGSASHLLVACIIHMEAAVEYNVSSEEPMVWQNILALLVDCSSHCLCVGTGFYTIFYFYFFIMMLMLRPRKD
jgi:hypothetical protein